MTKASKPYPAPSGKQAYDVGYGKPPEQTRFKPGRSGNPNGRPIGSRNKQPNLLDDRYNELLLEEGYREITVNDGGGTATMPMIQAVVRSMAMKAAKGDHRSQKLFSEMMATTESARVKDQIAMFETAIDYKNSSTKELERQKKLGLTDLPEPLPHPDHVIIDPRQGTVKIIGPVTIEEKVKWDKIVELRSFIEEQLALLIEEIAETKDPKLLKAQRKRRGHLRRVIEKANRALGIGED